MIQWFTDYSLPGTTCAFVTQDDHGNVAVVTHPARMASLMPSDRVTLLNQLLDELPEMTPASARRHLRLLA